MKHIYLILFFGSFFYSSAQTVSIPDGVFLSYLLNIGVDANHDEKIQVIEAESITSLFISDSNISDLTGIEYFKNLTSLTLQNLQLSALDISQNTNLSTLDCSNIGLFELDLSQNTNLLTLYCNNNSFTSLDLSQNTNLLTLYCNNNSLTSLDLSQNTNMLTLYCNNNNLTSLDLSQNTSLETLDCYNNNLSELDLSQKINLQIFNCRINQLTALDLSQNVNLKHLECNGNKLEGLDISQNINIEYLNCSANPLNDLDVTNNTSLTYLNCTTNQLTSLDVTNNINLTYFNCSNNNLSNIDVSKNTNFQTFYCRYNQLTSLDVSQNVDLVSLLCDSNQLTNMDLSQNKKLAIFSCKDNQLSTLFLKNGKSETIYLQNNPSLSYICADEIQVSNIQATVGSNVVVSSYCNFTPGGNYNTINGKVIFDTYNDGCDASLDLAFQNMVKLNVSNGSTTSGTFSNTDGNYLLYTTNGNYTLYPTLENNDYFNITPSTLDINFPASNSNYSQDFCITSNGNHPDLELVVLPITQTRPGFDTKLRLICKNKGNQTLSGNLEFSYDDSVLDFGSSSISPILQALGNLSWSFSDLLPFDSFSIEVLFNANSPVETPSLNDGDKLEFIGRITPNFNDESPEDNTFTLNQIVVNSFDPNDKTCLEGNIIAPDLIGEYVHYLIRCENTGTAEAINIVIKDVIDATKFDISTLFVTDSSHDMLTRINDNMVEFIFENINLPFDDANNDGYVAFKIKTLPTLQVGDNFENDAEIFFDYNAPIETNIASTSIENALGVEDFELSKNAFKMYPNPASNKLSIESKETIKSIAIYSVSGSLIQQISFLGAKTNIEISTKNLTKGAYFIKVSTDSGIAYKKLIKK